MLAGRRMRAQRRGVGVLQRHIQVGQDLRVGGHHLDQPVGDVAGVGVHDADPIDLRGGLRPGCSSRCGQPIFHAQVVAVIGGILGDQDHLAHAHVLQAAGLGQDRLHRAADGGAFDQRDGAEGARAAAAIGDLQIGAGALHGDALRAMLVGAHRGSIRAGGRAAAGACARAELLDHVDNIHPAAGAQDAVDARHLAGNFSAVALGQAAGGDQHLPFAFVRRQLSQHLSDSCLAGPIKPQVLTIRIGSLDLKD